MDTGGIASRKDKKLFQSCHILHKQGKYFIVHFKELFALDGKESDISMSDIERRNVIAELLQDWGLLKILDKLKAEPKASLSQIKVVSYKEKSEWELVPKYNIGGIKRNTTLNN
ncbi:translation repressor protein [bacterium]|nr:translation repressor protein [bacterium]